MGYHFVEFGVEAGYFCLVFAVGFGGFAHQGGQFGGNTVDVLSTHCIVRGHAGWQEGCRRCDGKADEQAESVGFQG